MNLNKSQIIDLLPHREPMLLIDELTKIKKLHSATAIVNVRKDSFFVQGHFPDNPILPGVIIIEALAQVSGILGFVTMNKTPEEGSIYYFVGADNVRFRSPVVPPSILTLESKKIQDRRGIWKFDCKASLEENLVCSATILCADRPK